MRKIKSMVCIVFMSVVLANNVFAVDSYTSVFSNYFENLVNTILSGVNNFGDDDCEQKICQSCKPTQPNCRPR